MTKEKTKFTSALEKATGEIKYNMTNDYMFRALFQQNPIVIGETINDKEFRLDIKAVLNHYQQINLEMQVVNRHDWPERSIGYLSRMYNSLQKGDQYINVKPAIHMGILNFSPFDGEPIFYSRNMLMDMNKRRIYSDKFQVNVLELKQVELATEEDKKWNLDFWAKLFKARTWEELKMIAKDNEYFTEASNTLCDLYADFNVRERCRDREDYELEQKYLHDTIEQMTKVHEQDQMEIRQKDILLEKKDAMIEQLRRELEEQKR